MKNIHSIEFYTGSKEELLPGFEKDFPYIASGRLVVVELKLDKFKPEYKGQVELYLKWLDRNERAEGEEKPIAIILCANKSNKMLELLELGESGIHVAQYLTKYVPKEILEQKLIDSIEAAKMQIEQRKKLND